MREGLPRFYVTHLQRHCNQMEKRARHERDASGQKTVHFHVECLHGVQVGLPCGNILTIFVNKFNISRSV
ncbi:hypothetical protein ACM0P6_01840 [Komagataeibacter sucrofermentans]|uniref:Uncharacterized protein n=1 Tax=Komagataeibacter sucrofermentans TaxID=1053551 RepID=A0A318QLF6_9PROT|nr:hypothetical protein [Komagataeibacter sucrofermentans]PYD78794.1 hypothetical protein CFR77_09685 [Komagataeibacter sucrofermentans]